MHARVSQPFFTLPHPVYPACLTLLMTIANKGSEPLWGFFFFLKCTGFIGVSCPGRVMWLRVVHPFPWRRQTVPVMLQKASPRSRLHSVGRQFVCQPHHKGTTVTRPWLNQPPSVGSALWDHLVRQGPSRRQAENSGLKVLLSQISWSLGTHLSRETSRSENLKKLSYCILLLYISKHIHRCSYISVSDREAFESYLQK